MTATGRRPRAFPSRCRSPRSRNSRAMPRSLSGIASATSGVGRPSFGNLTGSATCGPQSGSTVTSARRASARSARAPASQATSSRVRRSWPASTSSGIASARAAKVRDSAISASSARAGYVLGAVGEPVVALEVRQDRPRALPEVVVLRGEPGDVVGHEDLLAVRIRVERSYAGGSKTPRPTSTRDPTSRGRQTSRQSRLLEWRSSTVSRQPDLSGLSVRLWCDYPDRSRDQVRLRQCRCGPGVPSSRSCPARRHRPRPLRSGPSHRSHSRRLVPAAAYSVAEVRLDIAASSELRVSGSPAAPIRGQGWSSSRVDGVGDPHVRGRTDGRRDPALDEPGDSRILHHGEAVVDPLDAKPSTRSDRRRRAVLALVGGPAQPRRAQPDTRRAKSAGRCRARWNPSPRGSPVPPPRARAVDQTLDELPPAEPP